MSRHAWRVRAVALAALPLLAGCSDGEPRAPLPAPPVESLAPAGASAAQLAERACVRARLAEQGIAADAAATDVRRELAAARALAGQAAREDPAWTALAGGLAALDEALARDDGGAAALGVRVVRAECGRQ